MPSVIEDLRKGESFTDIPIVPAAPEGTMTGAGAAKPVTPEVLEKFDASNAQMREAFAKKGLPAPPLAPGEAERIAAKKAAETPADPFAGEQQVDAFAGEQEVKDAFSGERMADKLDEKTPEELAKDPDFNILAHIAANQNNIWGDPRRAKKAIDAYRAQKVEGLTAGKVYESVKKDTLPLVKDILKSIPKRLENISDIAIAPIVDDVTMKLRGEAHDPEKSAQWESMTEDAREAAIAEAIGGTQLAVGSLQDMVRQGARKLTGPGFKLSQMGVTPSGISLNRKDWGKISDDEVKNELFKDLGWHETVESIASGQTVKDLVSEGVEVNPENIKLLSLTDPITLVATAGGLKAVTTGGKVIFTAANEIGATKALQYLADAGKTAAAKSAQVVGGGAERAGAFVGRVTPLPTLTTGVVLGGATGHGVKAAATALGIKAGAKIIEKGGQLLREVGEAAGAAPKGQLPLGFETTTGAKVLNAAKAATAFVKPPVVGAVKGAAAISPLALSTDEPQGGLLGVGAIGGAVHGSLGAVKASIAESGAKKYFDPGQITWEKTSSPGYDGFTELNKVHEQVASTAPENSRNMVDSLREVLRPFGRKLFLVDDASFAKAIENDTVRANGGKPLTPEQQAAVAQEAKARGVSKIWQVDDAGNGEFVTMVKASADAPHEFSHVLESVMDPAAREKLHDAVRKAYTPEELDALKAHYESQLGRVFTPEEVRSEYIADNWANLLYNTSLESLGLPQPKRGFRQVLLDAAISLGDALGVDMTAGRKTPGLNLRPSYSLRKALVNASGEILSERNQRAAQEATAPAAPEPAVPAEPPVKPVAAEPPVQGELPLFEQPSAPTTVSPESPVSPPTGVPEKATVTPAAAPSARAEVTNTGIGATWAKGKDNEAAIVEVNRAMDAGEGVRVEHAGAPKTTFKPTEAERAAEVEEGRGLPPEAREAHVGEKYLTRWEQTKSGEPQVIARSVDKVVSNVDRVAQWAKATGEELPWETNPDGSLTQAGLDNLLGDLKSYWDNQDRGFRGGGEPLVRPVEDIGLSIPEQRGEPIKLGEQKEQWLNLLQGKEVGPPETARAVKGKLPANIKAQELRAAQGLESERIAPGTDIPVYPEKATQGRGPVEIKETNPLRNKLRAAGMPVEQLHSVVERLNAADITKAEPAPQLTGRGGSTDIARAGFLSEKPVSETIADVNKATPEEWTKFFGPGQSLTRSAYELGLGLKDRADLMALVEAQDAAAKTAQASMAEVKAGNFDALDRASSDATKAQFFREAIEAATDKGSAAGPVGWRRAFPDRTAPFAEGAPGEAQGMKQFLSPDEMPDDVDPIVTASIRTRDGKIYTGAWHGDAMDKIAAERGITDPDRVMDLYDAGELTDGFNTKSGKFLNRAEAAEHAQRIKQLKQPLVYDKSLESQEFAGKRAFMAEKPLEQQKKDEGGAAFARFFAKTEQTPSGGAKFSDIKEVLQKPIEGLEPELDAYLKYGSNFQKHIFTSIPGFLDARVRLLKGLSDPELFPDKEEVNMLDIGSSEGYYPKAWTERAQANGVNAKSVALDPSPTFEKSFADRPQVEGAEFSLSTFGEGFVDPVSGREILPFDPQGKKFDIVHEGMAFQFFTPDRAENFRKIKDLMTDDGVFVALEKVKTPDYAAREVLKDEYKSQFYSGEQLAAKQKEVLKKSDAQAVGMMAYQVPMEVLEKNLTDNWKHVEQIWSSGNFVGYIASDSPLTIERLSKAIGDTKTKFSVEQTPRRVSSELPAEGDVIPSEREGYLTPEERAAREKERRLKQFGIREQKREEKRDRAAEAAELAKFGAREREREAKRDRPAEAERLRKFGERERAEMAKREAERLDREETERLAKYNVPEEAKPANDKPTGWVLPNGDYVALDTDYHQRWLGENADTLNEQFGTAFSPEATVEDRLAALNKGFIRAREYGGKMVVEANHKFWKGAQKRAVEKLLDNNVENVDTVQVSLLNDEGQMTDTVYARLFDADDPRQDLQDALERLNPNKGYPITAKGPSAITIARSREGYLTKEKLTPKTAEAAAKQHNDEMTVTYPEAIPTRFIRDAKGKLKLQQGKLVAADEEAVLDKTPLALDAVRDNPDVAPKEAIAEVLSDRIVDEATAALKDPEVAKGLTWYDDAVKLIKKYFGKDAGMFAQLLAATSPQNGVQTNFLYAIDAWNAVKRGEYEPFKAKYLEGRNQWLEGGTPEIKEWEAETGKQWKGGTSNVALGLRNNFLTWWVDKHNILPKRAEGKLYGMHSFPVLDVISGTWLEDVGGPKVRNFLQNLTGEGHEATIDIWATRFLMRLAQSEDTLKGRWRVSPPSVWGISAANFDLAQLAFRKAAEKMNTKPDALQALVWFYEKNLWEQNDWTKTVGAAKSDYAYWLRGLEPGEVPETYNISKEAKAEAKRQGQTTGKGKKKPKSDEAQGELDIPVNPAED